MDINTKPSKKIAQMTIKSFFERYEDVNMLTFKNKYGEFIILRAK